MHFNSSSVYMPDSISIVDILKKSGSEPDSDNVGSTARRNIDKTGYCYHVITKAYLFFLGKYLFDNPAYLKEEGRIVPYSCFWMFEKSYFRDPYDKTLYKKLFGMEPPELLEFYQTKTKAEVKAFADMHFQNWTEKENRKLFVNANRLNR